MIDYGPGLSRSWGPFLKKSCWSEKRFLYLVYQKKGSMAKSKYTERNSKVDACIEVLESLEEIFNHLEGENARYNDLEHADYVNLVLRPLQELIDGVDTFRTNMDNGDYEPEESLEDFEE